MRRAPAALAAALLLMACGGSQPAPHIDAVKALRDGASAIASLKTVDATLKLTKGTITFQGFALVSAKTAVRLAPPHNAIRSSPCGSPSRGPR